MGGAPQRDRLQLPLVVSDALCERAYLCSKTGSRAGKSASGMCSAALLWKLLAGHLGKRAPKDLTAPRTWLTSCVRQLTNACRERIKAIWAWAFSPRCWRGYKSFGSRRASLARFLRRRSGRSFACWRR